MAEDAFQPRREGWSRTGRLAAVNIAKAKSVSPCSHFLWSTSSREVSKASFSQQFGFFLSGMQQSQIQQTQAADPVGGKITPLFHPRKDRWSEHFAWNDDCSQIVGMTAVGRATVESAATESAWPSQLAEDSLRGRGAPARKRVRIASATLSKHPFSSTAIDSW